MNNQGLLIIIAVILFGIFAVIFMEVNDKSPGEKIADSISEVTEEIDDEIDDHTDAR